MRKSLFSVFTTTVLIHRKTTGQQLSRYLVNVCERITSDIRLQWIIRDKDACFLVFIRYFCSRADQGDDHIQEHLERLPNLLLSLSLFNKKLNF